MKRWSMPHGDVGAAHSGVRYLEETGPSEIPCRVDKELPLERAISLANPANNGEALTQRVGDPVGSRECLDVVIHGELPWVRQMTSLTP